MAKLKDCPVCSDMWRRAIPRYKEWHKHRHVMCNITIQWRFSQPWITQLDYGYNRPPARNLIHKGGKGKGPRKFAEYKD